MPSTSLPQHRLMEARAHGATFPMALSIPMKVAKEFSNADKGGVFRHLMRLAKRKKPSSY